MFSTMRIFYSLLLGLVVLFFQNLKVSISMISKGRGWRVLKDGVKFRVASVLKGKGLVINARTYRGELLEDGDALYVGDNTSLSFEEIYIKCGDSNYKIKKLEPGYYIRNGEKLFYKKLDDNFTSTCFIKEQCNVKMI